MKKTEIEPLLDLKEVKKYLKSEIVCGYWGHEFRNEETDKELYKFIHRNKKVSEDVLELIGYWSCSRYARYFMDEVKNILSFSTKLEREFQTIINIGRDIKESKSNFRLRK